MSRLLISSAITLAVLSLSSNVMAQTNDYAPDYAEKKAKEGAKVLKDTDDQLKVEQNMLRKPLRPIQPTVQNTVTPKQLIMPPPMPAETGVDDNGNITVTTQDQNLPVSENTQLKIPNQTNAANPNSVVVTPANVNNQQTENVIFKDPNPPTNITVPNTQPIQPPDAALPTLGEAQNTAIPQVQNNPILPNVCNTGQSQSPINIAQFAQKPLSALSLSYSRSPIIIQNTGKTLELQYKSGSQMTLNGKAYALKSIDFHTPSEHYFNGAPYPMEAHLKHVAQDGSIAIIGVMIRIGQNDNEVIGKIWGKIPKRAGAKGSSSKQYNIANFLPTDQKYYTYNGSLTKAPCTENVTWVMMQQSVDISAQQLRTFQSLFAPNARPIQPFNGRQVQGN